MNVARTPELTDPVSEIAGVGPAIARHLGRLGIETRADLLLHLPFRYQNKTRTVPPEGLVPDIEALVEGQITDVVSERRGVRVAVAAGEALLWLRFYRIAPASLARFVVGRRVLIFGKPRRSLAGLEFAHPECWFGGIPESTLTPVYHTVKELAQGTLRRVITSALARLPTTTLADTDLFGIPGFLSFASALQYLHQPPPDADITGLEQGIHPARQRLALEELVSFELRGRRLRGLRDQQNARPLAHLSPWRERLEQGLTFALTEGQQEVLAVISADLARSRPMRRLLQGDVGCGKTVVAALAVAQAAASGAQSAVLAPTELLAAQHYRAFERWFAPLGVEVCALDGQRTGSERRAILARLASGEALIVVGTHALFQEAVSFARLGLVVIDEQHRFGVRQRAAMVAKGMADGHVPHQLAMTATPIPRSLAQTFYADLDLCEIRGRPPGRRPVHTAVLPATRRPEVIARVDAAVRGGRQVYWVCPAIEEGTSPLKAATSLAGELAAALPHVSVGLVHGRMDSAERAHVMGAFIACTHSLLVATTVIEVGVDVPKASLMIIEHAERLGLAQLHQLRGRVGRGSEASHCILLYQGPLSSAARERLQCLRETDDGFAVAERDLRLRGPGELFGGRQSGLPLWRVADLERDCALLPEAGRLAAQMIDHAPALAETVSARWDAIHDAAQRA